MADKYIRHLHSWAMSILLARMFNAKRPLRHIQSSRLCVSEQIPRCCGCRIRRLTNGIKRRMGRMLFDKICTRHEPSKVVMDEIRSVRLAHSRDAGCRREIQLDRQLLRRDPDELEENRFQIKMCLEAMG
ncbi:predicted protein [Histoplasma capsulatum G186AR]|uniref:Uncharacterized protein n=1 Tax=Ajellomyces capsulatus (strain G186AR / H82 / ATCC MYA-2454 / RMSCC 2432) TaxID=447093 RepID=C0NW78_AJECG|nr:uncharacterized protein HCBG_07408 [Histoplasma capsulatum G186AR]EEH04183.1 predicted protein [Histoplasma capsulatum G186AR]